MEPDHCLYFTDEESGSERHRDNVQNNDAYMKSEDCIRDHPHLSLHFHRSLIHEPNYSLIPQQNLSFFSAFAQATQLPHHLFSSNPVFTCVNPTLYSRSI